MKINLFMDDFLSLIWQSFGSDVR